MASGAYSAGTAPVRSIREFDQGKHTQPRDGQQADPEEEIEQEEHDGRY